MSRRLLAILGTLFSPAAWRSHIANRQGRAFDRRFGTDTCDKMPVSAMQGVDSELARHAVQYEASAIPKFRRALAAVERTLGRELAYYSFVDFGSGKGLVVMLAAQLSFKRVCGVEMAPALHAVARANVQKFTVRAAATAPISLACSDALTYAWPDGNVVAYLYNPFDSALTARFIERLTAEAERGARSIIVVYINPIHKELFDGRACFRPVFADRTLVVYEHDRSVAASGRKA